MEVQEETTFSLVRYGLIHRKRNRP